MFQSQQKIGPYTLVRLLGRGGFGEVWLAEKRGPLLTAQVALKLPLDPNPDLNAVAREAQVWLQASGHPNVLPVIDAEIYDGQVVIVSEYAAGGSLASWLKQNGGKAPSVEAAVAMTSGILAGLEYLHALKPEPIIHRDLKPDNVLLQGGLPRLTDFGISRVLKTTAQTQHSAGTPNYMPPEAWEGKYSPQSDVWAVGVMLYQMLSGILPFPQPDIHSLYRAILTDAPTPLPADIPAPLRSAVMKALEKDPTRRPPSAASMRLLLNPSPSSSVSTSSQIRPTSAASGTHPGSQSISRRAVTVGLVLGGAISVFAGYKLLSGKEEPNNAHPSHPNSTPDDANHSVVNTAGSDPGGEKKNIGTPEPVKKNSKDDADMVFIPAGEFTMGDKEFTDTKPHTVMQDGYYIYRTPVTVAQYLKFCDETGHARPSAPDFNPNWSKLDHPIVNVSYNDALAYCSWAGVKLPTEAQWEKAASWDDVKKEKRIFPWGEDFDRSKLWCSASKLGDAGGTKPVGSFPSAESPFGVLDMAGNVWQWCSDWYDESFYASRLSTERNPENQSVGEKKYRVLRGGSWYYVLNPINFRSAFRFFDDPVTGHFEIGFRCVSGL